MHEKFVGRNALGFLSGDVGRLKIHEGFSESAFARLIVVNQLLAFPTGTVANHQNVAVGSDLSRLRIHRHVVGLKAGTLLLDSDVAVANQQVA